MKFSYRVISLAILAVTVFIVYLTWGDDLITWNLMSSAPPDSTTQRVMSWRKVHRDGSHDHQNQHSKDETEPARKNPAGKMPPVLRKEMCVFQDFYTAKTTITTDDLLAQIDSVMEAGATEVELGVPAEGVPRTENTGFKQGPLQVIVVPHSHNDPGWHKTVEGYFEDQTKPTLDNMLEKLQLYPNMTFIWAESVFLHMWWQTLQQRERKVVRGLIRDGQLEIVVGSWVVPDEANPHFSSMVNQMVEGHHWLQSTLGVKPQNSWSLDPFGYSSSLPYLYKRAGFRNMVILRVHREVKALLENQTALEFGWRQSWDSRGRSDIFTLMMPYKLYNVKHTCGPNEDICLKFDFRKIPDEISEARPIAVEDRNVQKLAEALAEQYHKKASLYRLNVVLVPLGDDFRYDRSVEWDQQYGNYTRLFNYFAAHPELNIRARFGTVQDYFREVRKSAAALNKSMTDIFPTLSGDFFPYTDERQEYWTGYFTSRPFDKVLGVELEAQLRAAEIVHTLAAASSVTKTYDDGNLNEDMLSKARRNLALFQHHDAITGTSRSYVVKDSEERLKLSISSAQDVFRSAMRYLLEQNKTPPDRYSEPLVLEADLPITYRLAQPRRKIFTVPEVGRTFVIFNPLAQQQEVVVSLHISAHTVAALNEASEPVPCQVNPIWLGDSISKSVFQLLLLVDLPPLGSKAYQIIPIHDSSTVFCKHATIELYNSTVTQVDGLDDEPFTVKHHVETGENIVLQNSHLKAHFSRSGLLDTVSHIGDSMPTLTRFEFLSYNTIRSGAYIFNPEGPAKPIKNLHNLAMRVVSGDLVSEVQTVTNLINHTVKMFHAAEHNAQALEINNIVNLTRLPNTEVIMRINTNLDIKDRVFFTDLNGLQVKKRRAYENFPIEANYYPMTTFLYMEDEASRVTLISSQPLGVSSQRYASMEVMLDRRLQYDDGRGLGEGVLDNKPTPSRFYFLVEKKSQRVSPNKVKYSQQQQSRDVSFPSILAQSLANSLRYYPITTAVKRGEKNTLSVFSPLSKPLPCDVHLVTLRLLLPDVPGRKTRQLSNSSSPTAAMILHRAGIDCSFPTTQCSSQSARGQPSGMEGLGTVFRKDILKITEASETTLSLLHERKAIGPRQKLKLEPMNLYTYRVVFQGHA